MLIPANHSPFFTPIRYGLPGHEKHTNIFKSVFEWIEGYFPSEHLAFLHPLNHKITIGMRLHREQPSFCIKLSYLTLAIPLLVLIAKLFARAIYTLYYRHRNEENTPIAARFLEGSAPVQNHKFGMQIFIKDLTGRTTTLDVSEKESCSVIPVRLMIKLFRTYGKRKIESQCTFKNLVIICAGRSLDGSLPIAGQNVFKLNHLFNGSTQKSWPKNPFPFLKKSVEIAKLVDDVDALCMRILRDQKNKKQMAHLVKIGDSLIYQLEEWMKTLNSPEMIAQIDAQDTATRKTSGEALSRYQRCIPYLIGALRTLQPKAAEVAQLRPLVDEILPPDLAKIILSYLPAPAISIEEL